MYSTIIDATTAISSHGRPNLRWLDCRFRLDDLEAGRAAYRTGHVPGAVYVHLDEDLSGPIAPGRTGRHPLPDPEVMAARFGAWGIGNDDQVIVYDDMGGAIAARAWWMLRWLGHDAVAVLDGGWAAWLAAGGTAETEVNTPHNESFEPRPRASMLASVDEVAMAPSRGGIVIDARKAERFAGAVEPIDPVAGHVPGAVNVPFPDNLADGHLRSASGLRQRFETMLGGTSPADAIVYCGSGVTACHDLLAMEVAGLSGARLYAGSWSHWITDPSRPVAREP